MLNWWKPDDATSSSQWDIVYNLVYFNKIIFENS